MGQGQPFAASDDFAWLSGLVDTFERTEQLHDEQCDPAIVSAAIARLQCPATLRRDGTRRAEVLELSF